MPFKLLRKLRQPCRGRKRCALAVADNNQSGELHNTAALDGFGNTVQINNLLDKLGSVVFLRCSVSVLPLFILTPIRIPGLPSRAPTQQLCHTTMIDITTAVEHDSVDALVFGALCNQLADLAGSFLCCR